MQLRAMVERHLPVPHRFMCLSDVPVGDVERIPLRHNWPGWWSKIELFRNVFPVGIRVLYLDLDTIIVGDLSEIASREESFILMGDVYRRPPKAKRISYQSSMMMWTAGQHGKVYSIFAGSASYQMRHFAKIGDQGWIEVMIKGAALWENVTPRQVVSYKKHCMRGLPTDARVVIFHGKPRPWQAKSTPWVHKHYLESLECQALATC